MSDTCPSVECCQPLGYPQPPPSGIQGQLNGLLWLIPCSPHTPGAGCGCPFAPVVVSTVMTGTSDNVFNVMLRIRGIAEDNQYVGGSIVAGTGNMCVSGGAPPAGGRNVYKLQISDPAQTYFLNHNPAGFTGMRIEDFEFTVQIRTGATVTMTADPIDGVEVDNAANLSVPVGPLDPPIRVVQPYDGQFLQMDVVIIVA